MDTIPATTSALNAVKKLFSSWDSGRDVERAVNERGKWEDGGAEDVDASYERFTSWKAQWFPKGTNSDALDDDTLKQLWGVQGSTTVEQMLKVITGQSEKLVNCVREIYHEPNSLPKEPQKESRFSLKALQKAHGKQKVVYDSAHRHEIRTMAKQLRSDVEALIICSSTLYDFQSGIQRPMRDRRKVEILIESIMEARSGSESLYGMCSKSNATYGLEIDLFETHSASSNTLYDSPMRLHYQLLKQTTKGDKIPRRWNRVTVTSGPSLAILQNQPSLVPEPYKADFPIFEETSRRFPRILRCAGSDAEQRYLLQIPPSEGDSVSDTTAESLDAILFKQSSLKNPLFRGPLPLGVKIQLAYKIVECGLFLLGTPWLASLSSANITRLEGAKQMHIKSRGLGCDIFMLEICKPKSRWRSNSSPEVFTASAQLFYLGVLLMEIAVDDAKYGNRHVESPRCGKSTRGQIPLVRERMGEDYCQAMAFCLLYGESKVRDAEGDYVRELIEMYHEFVFSGLERALEHEMEKEAPKKAESQREELGKGQNAAEEVGTKAGRQSSAKEGSKKVNFSASI